MNADIMKRLKSLEARHQAGTAGIAFWRLNDDGTYERDGLTLSAEEYEKWKNSHPNTVVILDDIPRGNLESSV